MRSVMMTPVAITASMTGRAMAEKRFNAWASAMTASSRDWNRAWMRWMDSVWMPARRAGCLPGLPGLLKLKLDEAGSVQA